MGARIRAFDWSKTSLGPIQTWPQSLRTMVGMVINSKFPSYLLWGPDLIGIYNDAYRPLAGGKPELLGVPFREAWSEVWEDITPIVEKALAGEASYFENLLLPVNRYGEPEEAYFTFCYSPVRDESGRVAGLLDTVTETTRHVRTERALRESEDRFRNMADHAPVMMWITNAEGRCTYLNRSWYEFTGQVEAEALGLGWLQAIHPDDQVRSEDTFLKANARKEAFRLEYRIRRADGTYRWAIDAASPRFGADGAFLGYVGSVTDITDQKQAQQDLLSQKQSLESEVVRRTAERNRLWETTNDLMGTAGFDGFMKAINPAWTRMLGWSDEEILSRPFAEFVDPADHAETADVVRRLRARETVTGFVDHVLTRDGGQRTIMWTAVPDPGTDLFHIVGRDLTDQAQLEEQLRQSQKMEAVGQLTGGLAHDFNNLLAGISGSLELMDSRLTQGRIKDVERYMTAAQGAVRRAAALTHRLLAFSRRQTLDPRVTDVNQLVGGMAELIQRTVGPSIPIEIVGAAGAWPALVDPPQLENALLNLCINARDAMPDGGRITIETANRWMDDRSAQAHDMPPGQYLSLCVTDTGTGMTPDVKAKAFEPFYTTKPIGEGTGLGLSMIYGFARQSGGQVRIYSEVGQGTTVCIYLPRFVGDADVSDPLAALSAAPRAQHGETVLVVDDEPTIRMLVTEVLEDLGYTAIEAADSVAGLKVLQSDVRIDLLVTDVGLPGGMNGRQMAEAGLVKRPNLKVLFITGYAENAILNQGHLMPGMAVMTKPFAVEALGARIREMLAAR